MKAISIPLTVNHIISTFTQSAKEALKPWALPLTILLLFAAIAPSAHGQTLTVLHSFTGISTDGMYPAAGLIRNTAGILYGTTHTAALDLAPAYPPAEPYSR